MVIPPAPSGGPYSEATRNKSALTCSILAVAWGMVLVVGALTFPVYQGRTITVACPGCPLIVEVDASRGRRESSAAQPSSATIGKTSAPIENSASTANAASSPISTHAAM